MKMDSDNLLLIENENLILDDGKNERFGKKIKFLENDEHPQRVTDDAAGSSIIGARIQNLNHVCSGIDKANIEQPLVCSCNVTKSPAVDITYRRSRSWCGVSDETSSEARGFRESFRLLRTQARPLPTRIRTFSRSQILTLITLALVDFMSFCSMSIMAPFFPREAQEKGLSEAMSGLVFSFYAFVMFLTSPMFGKLLPVLGAKFVFISGVFVTGTCNILFGILEYIYDYERFTTFCFMIRGFEALGASAYSTASYVFVVNAFPNNISAVLGILETFIGLGMSVGPAIGGLLYSVGGFGLPFYVLGVAMVLTIPVNFCLLPAEEENTIHNQTGSILNLIKVPTVFITSLVIIVVSNTWAFLDPTLEPHLRQFDLSTEHVGLIFLLFSGLYGISSPIWGWLADKIDRHWCMMVWGLLFCTVGLLLLGPSPLLPFLKSSLILNIVGLSIIGISVALTLLPTFQGVLLSSVEEGGYSYNLATYGAVAGVWSCMYSLGEVIGPSLGGVFLKNYGFPVCSTIMASLTFALAIITLLFFSIKDNIKPSRSSTVSEASNSENGCSNSNESESNECQPLITRSGEFYKSFENHSELFNVTSENITRSRSQSMPKQQYFDVSNTSEKQEERMRIIEMLKYNINKVNYYKQNRKDSIDNDELDKLDEKTDVRGTINISLGGACEV